MNPGLDVFPCGLCGEAVSDQDKAICCDSCEKWIHVSCDHYFTEDEYDYLVQNPSSDPWFCSACIEEPAVDPSGCQHSVLRCVCLNARSLFPKRYDRFGYLSSVNADIVAVTETFLDDTILNSQFCPKHFICFRRDRDRHGGGVLILIKSSIPAVRRSEFESHCEIIWIQLSTSDGPLLFGVFYRSPNSDVSTLIELNTAISTIPGGLRLVLCGDFNVPDIDWSMTTPKVQSFVNSTFCDIVSDNFLTQLVHQPTRGDHILDLIFTNHLNCVSSIEVVDNLPGTDHDAVEFVVSSSVVNVQPDRVLYNYTKADFSEYLEVLSRVPWDCIPFDSDVEYAWACWKDLFFSVVSATIPTVKWRQSKMKHWFSPETLHLIQVKRHIYRQMKKHGTDLLKRKYKAISNLVRLQTRKDTTTYVSNLSSSYLVNSKKFWNFLNSMKGRRHPIPPLKQSDALISDDYDKASVFNRYFHSVFTVECCDNIFNLRQSLEYHPDLINTIDFSVEEVHGELLNLQGGKACGPDHVSAHLLQKGADFLAPPLTKLFQLSFSTGILPSDWVTANVVPVHKKGDKHLSSNYRPISLTSIVVN